MSETLASILRERAGAAGDRLAYVFLDDDGNESARLTYTDLDRRARAVAAVLQSVCAPGERALLLYPPGPEFVSGFFGCLLAGVVAVPAYPPEPGRLDRTLPRLQAIALDAEPSAVIATRELLALSERLFERAPELKAQRWLATDALPEGLEHAWRAPPPSGAPAFIQYTSGSTGSPKGVVLSHANLMHNSGLIQDVFGIHADSVVVGWLPPYHDMGLCGKTLQPLYSGCPAVLMSPLAFLRRPARWLEAITRYRGTVSGGPNFAYALCVRKTTEDERARFDLRSWEVAFSGAEPVRPGTLRRFADAFAPAGLRWNALTPCYGLAEGTLMVVGSRAGEAPKPLAVRAGDLRRGRAVDAGECAESVELVGSGAVPRGAAGHRVRVVDPDTGVCCPPDRVGEVWVASPSVAGGYWRQPDATREAFEARLAGDAGPTRYLRTGDLGFVRDGELFVTGRIKDLIVIRGQNHYPHDLEASVEAGHPALRPGCAAAFSVEGASTEELVIACEVADAGVDAGEVVEAVCDAVRRDHDLGVACVVLLEPRTIPKTSSGKVRRRECRDAFRSGSLRAVSEWRVRGGRAS